MILQEKKFPCRQKFPSIKVFVKQGALPGLSEARLLERRGGGRESEGERKIVS